MREFLRGYLIAVFSRLGAHLFGFMAVSSGSTGEPFAFHFAASERDMNCAVRDYVEALDNRYDQQDDSEPTEE